ncbi:MAG TPA: glycosyltransferase family 2 protein [Abditibacterium sp.]|jgi:rhamnosyltransferase
MTTAISHPAPLPDVSIVLPTLNGEAHLRELLPAIQAQRGAGEIEIVAIDSSSRDASVSLLKEFGARVFSIASSEFGHGKTRNWGVQLARGEIVVFLSQDALPVGQNWLCELVSPLQNHEVGATFARQLPREGATPFEKHLHFYLYGPRSRKYQWRQGRELELRKLFFSNVCSAARREVCLRFPFDQTRIMSEDQFFARDLLTSGLAIVYNARCEVRHSHSYDLGALFRRNFDSGHSLRDLGNEKWQRRIATALRFWSSAAFYTAGHRHWKWLLFLPLYEATRLVALISGSQAERLPLRWRRALSLHRSFWDNRQ